MKRWYRLSRIANRLSRIANRLSRIVNRTPRLRVAVSLCLLASLAALLALGVVSGVSAQSGGGYDLTWNTIDGGGATFSTGGGYSLGGTVGQPDAGTLSGGPYTLAGGFWGGGAAQYRVYLPLVLRNYP